MGTIVFDGITLNPNLIWRERFSNSKVAQLVKYTLGGKPVVYSGELVGGFAVTLEATQEQGWLKKEVVDQLLERANTPGARFPLVIDGMSMQVMFRVQDDPALEMIPFVPRVSHEEGDYFYGTLKFMVV